MTRQKVKLHRNGEICVAISGNGNGIAVAASYQYANQPRYVDLFEWNGSAWVQQGSSITGKIAGDYFGLKMALSYDGRGVAIFIIMQEMDTRKFIIVTILMNGYKRELILKDLIFRS